MDDFRNGWLGAAVDKVRAQTNLIPRVGIILGSGLGGMAAEIEREATLPYGQIPGFPVSTAIGHKGQLTLGHFAGCPVAVLEGRFHLYEGYTAEQVTRPIHLLRALGIEVLVVTNAAGGLNPGLRMGDVVVLEDHVNLMWTVPKVARPQSSELLRDFGALSECDRPLTPALSPMAANLGVEGSWVREWEKEDEPSSGRPLYDPQLADWAVEAARLAGASSSRGIYIGMTGPNYETRAEYRALRMFGDLVGMSTVPEVLTAHSLDVRVLALSVVSNECNPDQLEPTDGAQVVAAVSRAEGRIRSIVRGVVERWR